VAERPRGQTYEVFGAYVRSQRQLAQLSLRQAAMLARISNPYLSQIEHGLALPSITVISALADALLVSAETLLLRAAGVATGDATERSAATEDAIRHDPRLDDAQKHAMLGVLTSFVGPSPSRSKPTPVDDDAAPAVTRAPRRRQPPKAPAQDREVQDNG
jgi:transcriptional regulator with XRE-family HTH domain